jgi:hypothetical protein
MMAMTPGRTNRTSAIIPPQVRCRSRPI